MLKSLQNRILFLASVTLALFSGLTSLVLQQAFNYSLEEGAKARLQAHIYTLLAAADLDGDQLQLPIYLQEDRFNQIQSDLYGFVTGGSGDILWRSKSAVGLNVKFPRALGQGVRHFQHSESELEEPLMFFSMGVVWEVPTGGERTFTFTIIESKRRYLAEQEGFKKKVRNGLWGGSIVLIILQFIILKWGLAPLKKIALAIRQVEEGRSDALTGNFPKELSLIARNINMLVNNERRQRERYRTTMGDLAHSLKTPLAVIRNGVVQAGSLIELKALSGEQLDRMEQIVKHQLQRAVAASPNSVVQGCYVLAVVTPVCSALRKVYFEKDIIQNINIEADLIFHGEEADLMEVIGNVLDNAHKHCKKEILIQTVENRSEEGLAERLTGRVGHSNWVLQIEDDGAGIVVEERQKVLQRGIRADSRQAGQGIGLAVAVEIVEGYGGVIEVGESTLGGACFTLSLPMRKSGKGGDQTI